MAGYGVGVSDDEDRVARVSGNFRGDGTRVRRRVVGAVNDDWLHMACCCERRGGLSGAAEFSRDDDVHTRRPERGRQGRGARLSRRCQVGIVGGLLRFLGVPDQDDERRRRRLCRRRDHERSQCDQERVSAPSRSHGHGRHGFHGERTFRTFPQPSTSFSSVFRFPFFHEAEREEAQDAHEDGDRVRRVRRRHADAGRRPERGRSRGPVDTASDVQDGAAADESHAGEQPLKDARLRVRASRERHLRNRDVAGRPDRDEWERAEASASIFVLPIPRYRERQEIRDGESHGQIDRRRHGSILAPAAAKRYTSAVHFSVFGQQSSVCGKRPTANAESRKPKV